MCIIFKNTCAGTQEIGFSNFETSRLDVHRNPRSHTTPTPPPLPKKATKISKNIPHVHWHKNAEMHSMSVL